MVHILIFWPVFSPHPEPQDVKTGKVVRAGALPSHGAAKPLGLPFPGCSVSVPMGIPEAALNLRVPLIANR